MKNGICAMGAAAALGLVLLLPATSVADETDGDPVAAAAWKRMAELGRQSSDLRVRIVYSLGDFELRDGGGVRQQEAIPIETLVEQARGSTDPVVLSLLVDRCSGDLGKAGRCDPRRPGPPLDRGRHAESARVGGAFDRAWNSGDVDGARVAFPQGGTGLAVARVLPGGRAPAGIRRAERR